VLAIVAAPPLPTFPTRFSGRTYRNTTWGSNTLKYQTVAFDLDARKAYTKFLWTFPKRNTTENWVIFGPDGAIPGSYQQTAFVYFTKINFDSDISYCTYNTEATWSAGGYQPIGDFPPHWVYSTNDGYVIKMSNWFLFNDMVYQDGGFNIDTWVSQKGCTVFGEDTVPCYQVSTKKSLAVPVTITVINQGVPGTGDDDWIVVDKWELFDPKNVPAIIPPPNWPTTCYNRNSMVAVDPKPGWYISTPTQRATFTVTLAPNAAPIPGLGPVFVEFMPDRTDLVKFLLEDGTPASGNIQFTTDNYNKPITVYLQYVNSGITEFYIRSTGGGYDIPHLREYDGTLEFWTETGINRAGYPFTIKTTTS